MENFPHGSYWLIATRVGHGANRAMSATAEEMKRRFASKLAVLIGSRVPSQAELVRRSGLAQTQVQRLCDAKGNPRLYQAAAIARACEVPIDWLAADEGVPVPGLSDPWELKVREAAGLIGWEEVYRRIVGARPAEQVRHEEASYDDVKDAARKIDDQIRRKLPPGR
jgi:transcriptional regulator with XRE-family HTH domain